VPRHSHHSDSSRTQEPSPYATTRADHTSDAERPLADMRKNLNNVLRLLFLHRWAFFVPCCTAATIVFVLSLSYPRTYMATTSFERRDDPIMLNLNLSEGTGSWSYFRSTMVQDITSPEVMSEAVENMGLTQDLERDADGALTAQALRRRDSLARSLGSTISVGWKMPSPHIDIMTLTYTGPDPQLGKQLVDAVKKAYIRRAMGWIQAFLEDQQVFFNREAEGAFKEWGEAKQRMTELLLDNPYVDAANPSAITTELAQRETQQRNLRLRRSEYEAERIAQRQLLAAGTPAEEPDGHAAANLGDQVDVETPLSAEATHLREEIVAVEEQIDSLKTSRGMRDEHPEIKELLAKRNWLEERFARQRDVDRRFAQANRGVMSEASTQKVIRTLEEQQRSAERVRSQVLMDATDAKIKEIDLEMRDNEAVIAQLSQAQKTFHEFQKTHAALTEHIASAKSKYKLNEGTLRSLDPALNAIRQGKLLKFFEEQPARGSAVPISPKTTTVFLLAVMAGIGAGALFVILAEVFDHVLRSTSHVSRSLGVPILETIDEIVTTRDRRRNLIRHVVFAPVLVAIGFCVTTGTASLAYLSIERPSSYKRILAVPEKAVHFFVTLPESAFTGEPTRLPRPGIGA
jgi:uncharacterized protein involved in exopolysaccharide biosynthesis